MPYNMSLSSSWMDGSQFLSFCSATPINMTTRILLLSDGSLIRFLNALFLSPITLQRLRQEEVSLDNEMAGYIEAAAGQEVIDRDVWLMNGSERLVYANSILPTSLMRDDIYNGIIKGDTPIGALLSEQSILTCRDKLRIAQVIVPEVSRELGLPEDMALWARRYRLNTEGGFKGAILEIFSPGLFGGQ